MAKTSILMPVYNEVNFIRRTLESVVGEADEIIISDNCSTDGTSEICREFAEKYPEIKYFRQEKNIGSAGNFKFLYNQINTEYFMDIGAHDVLSRGAVKKMAAILDEHPDVVKVIFSDIVDLNHDYCYKSLFRPREVYGEEILSDSPFERVKSTVSKYSNGAAWFGLIRTDAHNKIQSDPYAHMPSDHAYFDRLAHYGKFAYADATFFRVHPRPIIENNYERGCRVVKAACPDKQTVNPYEWIISIIADVYILGNKMQNMPDAPEGYSKLLLDIAVAKRGFMPYIVPSLENIDFPQDKIEFFESVFEEIMRRKPEPKKNNKIYVSPKDELINFIKLRPLKFLFTKKFYKLCARCMEEKNNNK